MGDGGEAAVKTPQRVMGASFLKTIFCSYAILVFCAWKTQPTPWGEKGGIPLPA